MTTKFLHKDLSFVLLPSSLNEQHRARCSFLFVSKALQNIHTLHIDMNRHEW